MAQSFVARLRNITTEPTLSVMDSIPIETAGDQLADLAARVGRGEKIVITRDGQPIAEVVPHVRTGGIDFAAIDKFKRDRGIDTFFNYIAPDFDDPLPDDFLLQPLPDRTEQS